MRMVAMHKGNAIVSDPDIVSVKPWHDSQVVGMGKGRNLIGIIKTTFFDTAVVCLPV